MEFIFTGEQLMLQESLRQYAKEKLLPQYAHWDKGETISREELREAAKLGIFGLRVPEKFGGQETDYITCGLMV